MSLERLSSNFVHRYVTSSVHLTMTNYPIMDVAGLRDPMFTFEVPLSLERVKVGRHFKFSAPVDIELFGHAISLYFGK